MAIVISGDNGIGASNLQILGGNSLPGLQIQQTGTGSSLTIEDPNDLSTNFTITCNNRNTLINNQLVQFLEDGLYINKNKFTQDFFEIVIPSVGQYWTPRDFNRNWLGVAMSTDGRYQTAVVFGSQIYTSTDYGVTRTARESSRYWTSVAMSADGRYQTATVNPGRIYTSTDYGVTWTARDSNRNWLGVAMSADGRYQTAVAQNGQIHTSTNYGITWTPRDFNRNWVDIAISADGKYQTAVVYTLGQIYTSTDYGVTWTARESSRSWTSVAMSADGRYQTATVNPGRIYTSTDYGVTWTARDSNRNWLGVAMSTDGRYQTAVVFGSQIYTSTDYGVTWTPRDSNRNWRGVAMSADGRYQTAVVESGQIYTSRADIGMETGEQEFSPANEIPLMRAPYIIYLQDTRSGNPPSQLADTPIQTTTFTLTKPATIQVYVNTIALHTTRVDTYLTINGVTKVRTLTGSANIGWQPVQLFWTELLQAGEYTVDYRCTVANVIGSGSLWGRMMIKFLERL